MTEMNMVQALNLALAQEMRSNPDVVLLGEDVGKVGGVFRVTQGLWDEFGDARVIDTPLAEGGIIGTAIGMSLYGLKPIAEIQFSDFIFPAFDQIVSEAAKMRYRSGGEYTCPLVIRAPIGGGIKGGLYHSQSPEAYFIHTPGLHVVCPSNPYDAKGMFHAAMKSEDPVLFFEPKRVYRAVKMDVPDAPFDIAFGKAKVVREGTDATLISWGAMLYEALASADKLSQEGYAVEVIDLRSLAPLDTETLVESVKKTGRVCVVHEAPKTCGFGAEVLQQVTEGAFLSLEAPPLRITGLDTPFPYTLENDYLPLERRITPALRELLNY